MEQFLDIDKKIMLFGRETEGKRSRFWSSDGPFDDETRSYIATKGEFVLWEQSKREFTLSEVLERNWVKTCPAGYVTTLQFRDDGTLTDTTLFEGVELNGYWCLETGILKTKILGAKHTYEFDVLANETEHIHSAVEFEDGKLHSYLKLIPVY